MAASVTVSKVRRVASTGRIYIQFADGPIQEFQNLAEVAAWAAEADANDPRVMDWLRRAAIRYFLHRDPTGASAAVLEGKTFTLDLSATPPLGVS